MSTSGIIRKIPNEIFIVEGFRMQSFFLCEYFKMRQRKTWAEEKLFPERGL
jgi:hypothetical protein